MSEDLVRARELLEKDKDTTCVVCKGDILYTSTKKGVSPMLDWIQEGVDLQGFAVADKIVGKAAAMLFAFAGIREVYAGVISQSALPVINEYGIEYTFLQMADTIINRQGSGICPMEQAVAQISDLEEAIAAIKKRREELKKKA